ncbi:MAG: hypothetical protein JSW35_03865 [Deltaproteobacteria bacterium]|nr:MAG: hypothetical protein JSW35_03865 [Deltaproteobacteria bacterium]
MSDGDFPDHPNTKASIREYITFGGFFISGGRPKYSPCQWGELVIVYRFGQDLGQKNL